MRPTATAPAAEGAGTDAPVLFPDSVMFRVPGGGAVMVAMADSGAALSTVEAVAVAGAVALTTVGAVAVAGAVAGLTVGAVAVAGALALSTVGAVAGAGAVAGLTIQIFLLANSVSCAVEDVGSPGLATMSWAEVVLNRAAMDVMVSVLEIVYLDVHTAAAGISGWRITNLSEN